MTEPVRPSPVGGGGGFRFPFNLRTGAILLMVAGAAGFVAARILFGEQVLCLFGSTLVVFAGLGLLIYARRIRAAGNAPGGPSHVQRPLPPPGSGQEPRLNPRQVPRGLRAAARQQMAHPPEAARTYPRRPEEYPSQPPRTTSNPAEPRPDEQWAARTEPMPRQPVTPEPEPLPVDNLLLDAVITTFEQQGAQVNIDTQRDDRGILSIQARDGLLYTALVLQTPVQVEAAEVRALYALMTSSGSVGGYLISAGDFSQRAYDWAGQHRIRLVAADEIDELGI